MNQANMKLFLTLICSALPFAVNAVGEQRFSSPQEAVDALTLAARDLDTNAIRTIFGPETRELMSPDPVQASNSFAVFAERVTNKIELAPVTSDEYLLRIGWDAWPFPIPLAQDAGKWFFDTKAGKEEILDRRIGMDELAVIDVCHAYVDAQREYASEDRNHDDVLEFAEHLRSSHGKHDGLYWHAEPGEDPSPLGPLISEAHELGYSHENKIMGEQPQNPYHGYYFKILTRQGPHAPAGKYSYIINGHMIGGFALVAWPAQWNNTGMMTFIVSQQNKVYQKDLGKNTDRIARRMTAYDPDPSWKLIDQ